MKHKPKRITLKLRKGKVLSQAEKEDLRAEIKRETRVYLKDHDIQYIKFHKSAVINPVNVAAGLCGDLRFRQHAFN